MWVMMAGLWWKLMCVISHCLLCTSAVMSLAVDCASVIDCLIHCLIDALWQMLLVVLCIVKNCVWTCWQRLPALLWHATEDEVQAVCEYYTSIRVGKTTAVWVRCRSHDGRHQPHSQQSVVYVDVVVVTGLSCTLSTVSSICWCCSRRRFELHVVNSQ